MNRTTATCIAGMRSKTTTGIKTHFQRPKKPRGRSLLRGFGLGIFAKRLRSRPSATRCISRLCECGESVIVVGFIADPMTFLRAISLARRSFGVGGCSMKITEDVPKYVAERGVSDEQVSQQGMEEKAREFNDAGAEVYAKA
jgi:hypothetical protein